MRWHYWEQRDFVRRLAGMNKNKKFIIRLSKNYSDDIPKPTKWIPWEEWDWTERADFYTVLPNQVVLDIDTELYCECYYLSTRVNRRLLLAKIPYWMWASGGKGLHFDVFLNVKNCDENTDWREIRCDFASHLLKGINYCVDEEKDKWAIDKRKFEWDDNTMGSLVRIAGGKKWGFKIPITKVPDQAIIADKPKYPKGFIKYHWVKEIKIGERPPRRKVMRPFNPENYKELDLCILDMIEMISEGNHLTHIQNLAIAGRCYLAGYTIDQIHEVFYNDPKYNPKYTEEQYYSVVKELQENPHKVISCQTIRKHGWCPSEIVCREMKRCKK